MLFLFSLKIDEKIILQDTFQKISVLNLIHERNKNKKISF